MIINPIKIPGPWRYGVALDWHTISSKPREEGGFDTNRSEIGEALYELKYKYDRSKIQPIAEIAAQHIMSLKVFKSLNAILAMPPSQLDRPFQPVLELAKAISDRTALDLPENYLIKNKQTQALKNIEENSIRQKQLQDAFTVTDQRYAQGAILLFDDLIRSGTTLNAVYDILTTQGGVKRIYVLTVTRTRTRR